MTASLSRRAFLGRGSLAVAAAAGVLSCADDTSGGDGDASSPAAGVGTSTGDLVAGDVDLLMALTQLELSVAAAHRDLRAARSDELLALGADEMLVRFVEHHRAHAARLNELLVSNGAPAVARGARFAGLVLPTETELLAIPADDVIDHARDLEDQLTQTYVEAVPRLQLPSLRRRLMEIGAAEARHVAYCDLLVGDLPRYLEAASSLPASRYPTERSFFVS
ncbi:MAG TPA: ferritin-like domain-containing protein [Acidimicrobiales bacterium]|nr:ferritin-like domain-containing protein [Acidimicrobiales bacterium]